VLVFLDETARTSERGHALGALCGIAIPEQLFADVTTDLYSMKYNSFGAEFARERELKGSLLLKRKNFREADQPGARATLTFVTDLLHYIVRHQFVTFGIVCFDQALASFRCDNPYRLDATFRALFERLDTYMRNVFPGRQAKIVFDDVDYGTNAARAAAITNFFNRTSTGRGYDTIIRTPFFAVSQAQNVGLQLADVVTTVYGMRFQGNRSVFPFFQILKRSLYVYQIGAQRVTTLRVFRNVGA
jgi:hypothetical protein